MLLKELKQRMLLPKEEIFINKTVNIRGIDVHFLSLTSEEKRNVLWTMHRLPDYLHEEIDSEGSKEHTTNREEMIDRVKRRENSINISISEIIIQNQKMIITSSSANGMRYMTNEDYMNLQHFIEKGIDTANWDEVELDNIIITTYEQREGEAFPEIDSSKELDITIKLRCDLEEVLINQPLCLNFNEMEKEEGFYFYDSIERKNRAFYIDKMEHYDIWEDTKKKFEDERIQNFTEEQINEAKENYYKCLEDTCPKGMDLAMVEYEAEDNIQLRFFSKEYLDQRPVVKNYASSMGFINLDKNLGQNGLRGQLCMIKPIEKDFNGSIEVELFSWLKQIPEEIIKI